MNANRFVELYQPIHRDLYRFALYTMGAPADAEDAVSESMLVAWEKRMQLRNEASFRSWIFQITANTCRRRLKQGARTVPVGDGFPEPCDRPRGLDAADAAAVRQLFNRLEDKDRLIVALSVFGGYRSREIAEMLSMNASTVRSRRKRALDWMATQWKGVQ